MTGRTKQRIVCQSQQAHQPSEDEDSSHLHPVFRDPESLRQNSRACSQHLQSRDFGKPSARCVRCPQYVVSLAEWAPISRPLPRHLEEAEPDRRSAELPLPGSLRQCIQFLRVVVSPSNGWHPPTPCSSEVHLHLSALAGAFAGHGHFWHFGPERRGRVALAAFVCHGSPLRFLASCGLASRGRQNRPRCWSPQAKVSFRH